MIKNIVEEKTNEIITKMKEANYLKKEINLVKDAIAFAVLHHDGQLRKSGDPFVTHPLQVALILIDWNMDYATICAGILHDVLEDTHASEEDLKNKFNDDVFYLVKSVTKISKYSNKNRSENVYGGNKQNYLIQVFLNISKDLRVLFVKIADRYHNMKTIFYLKKEKQKRIALETKEIYANLAGRLGMYKIKVEMLDICMKILDSSTYEYTKKMIESQVKKYNDVFLEIINRIETSLTDHNIKFKTSSRIKSVYSTYSKLLADEEITDLFAMRIIVESTLDCYLVLGIIHTMFYNLKNSFKDFISTPKANLYQSLHTAIFYKELNVEIQIRTKEMDKVANFGVASHWRYKEEEKNPFSDEMNTLALKIEDATSDVDERLNTIKKIAKQKYINIYNQNIEKWENINENINVFEFAALSDIKKLPYLKEIYVNNSRVSIFTTLDSGDMIRIIYDNKKTINKSWLNWTKDQNLIKWLNDEINSISLNIQSNVSSFIDTVNKKCNTNYDKKTIEDFILNTFNINSIKEFLENMKVIRLNKNELLNIFSTDKEISDEIIKKVKSKSWKWVWENSLIKSKEQYYVNNIIITKCCSKIPPLNTVGVLNGDVLEVHKYDCKNVNKNDKIVVLNWDKEKLKKTDRNFRAKLILTGAFSNNTSISIVSAIQKYKNTISSYIISKDKKNKTFTCDLVLYVKNYSNIEKLMNELSNKSIIKTWKLI